MSVTLLQSHVHLRGCKANTACVSAPARMKAPGKRIREDAFF